MALLGNLTGSSQFFNSTEFYNGVATQSLRRNDDDSAYLYRTPSSASNRKTYTFSCWYKRANLSGVNQPFFYAGSSGSDFTLFYIDGGSHRLSWYDYDGSTDYGQNLSIILRDTSAWYHLVFAVDTTQATDTNRVKIYVNGTLHTDVGADYGLLPQDYDTRVNDTKPHCLGRYNANYIDGYMAETNFVDGTQLAPTSFGETKNGVWIPKKYTGSYGTNGFRLQFNQTGVGTASASTIGADTSGNTHHFTSSGIVASDCNMPDSPENNFCTLNPNARGTTNVALSEGNLKFVKSSANFGNVLGTMPLFSGKWYCEAYITSSNLTQVGVQEVTNNIYTSSGDFGPNTDLGMWDSRGYYYDEGTAGGSPPTYTTGDIINIAFDVDAGKIWFGKNNTYNHSGDPANGTNQTTGSTDDLSSIGVTIAGNGENGGTAVYNCGQDSSFLGNKTAQGNTDGNGIGDFYYAPPSGFLAMCTANLPEPTIGPNSATQADDHFDIVLRNGTGSEATQALGFKPDFLWTKTRSHAVNHNIASSSLTYNYSFLQSNTTEPENTSASTYYMTPTSTGYTVGTGDNINQSGRTFVDWLWKANGGTTTTNDASATSIGSQDSVYQANTTAGFSIVTYTGTGSNDTFAHGVQVNGVATAPNWIIHKRKDSAQHWVHYHVGIGNTRSVLFNADAQNSASAVNFNNTSPTSTVFSLGTDAYANASGGTYIAFCFAEVEGYNRFGSYIGNGSTDGTFVYTGFAVKWLMIKRIDSAVEWTMFDSARSPFNVRDKYMYANTTLAESTYSTVQVDFLSNGFKSRGTFTNVSGGTYIYMAFAAEAPFKYANAR